MTEHAPHQPTPRHIVTAVEILDRNAADCPQFPTLVNATAVNFTVEEVAADKAYLGNDNHPLQVECHNICCVILAQCELGIDAVFWDEKPPPARMSALPSSASPAKTK
jgi:hypothetical protein